MTHRNPCEQLRELANRHGFADVGVGFAVDGKFSDALKRFIRLRRHGDMGWMAKNIERRLAPDCMWEQARSALIVADSYAPDDPLSADDKSEPVISHYARGADYHKVMKKRLRCMAEELLKYADSTDLEEPAAARIFVDTAPLMEKPLAQSAGIGWIGKHTNLVSRKLGSWFFIGAILVNFELPSASTHRNHCGSCRACLDSCPTAAFPAPFELDARRCISYLTIEHKGPIARGLRPFIGQRIFGCDICLAACPWNKFAKIPAHAEYRARYGNDSPDFAELATLSDLEFRKRFSDSPVKRLGRDCFLRNVMIAIGNSGNQTLAKYPLKALVDESELVKGSAIWALSRLLNVARLRQLYGADRDISAYLGEEWRLGIAEAQYREQAQQAI